MGGAESESGCTRNQTIIYKQENGGQIKLIISDVSKIFTLISGNAIKMFDGDIESAREIYQ